MSPCARPLDPLDAEALASGAAPFCAPDAGDHVRGCLSCAARVSEAAALARALDELGAGPVGAPADRAGDGTDLAAGVVRIRPFSRRERRDPSLWRGAVSLAAALFFAGLLLLVLPAVTAREQAGLTVAALAPVAAVLRAAVRSLAEIAAASPAGLEALGLAVRRQAALGFACLFLLVPVFWGLTRALARQRRR